MRTVFITLPIALWLSGCAVMNEDFSCSAVDGIEGCITMSEINTHIDEGHIRTDSRGNVLKPAPVVTVKENKAPAPETQDKLIFDNTGRIVYEPKPPTPMRINSKFASDNSLNAPFSGKPFRVQEQVRELIIFPYEDKDGNYHDTAIMHIVITPSHWQPLATNAIKHSVQ